MLKDFREENHYVSTLCGDSYEYLGELIDLKHIIVQVNSTTTTTWVSISTLLLLMLRKKCYRSKLIS